MIYLFHITATTFIYYFNASCRPLANERKSYFRLIQRFLVYLICFRVESAAVEKNYVILFLYKNVFITIVYKKVRLVVCLAFSHTYPFFSFNATQKRVIARSITDIAWNGPPPTLPTSSQPFRTLLR